MRRDKPFGYDDISQRKFDGKNFMKKLKKNSLNFLVNREMREKNRVYNLILDEIGAKL